VVLQHLTSSNLLQTAIIYEAHEPGEGCRVTYANLLCAVLSVANALNNFGVKKGDTISIYLPMTCQAVVAFLACIRTGAVHWVAFSGSSAVSLRDRIPDCKSHVTITSDEGRHGGKMIANKNSAVFVYDGASAQNSVGRPRHSPCHALWLLTGP
jgi:acetyl-CoA synthetase